MEHIINSIIPRSQYIQAQEFSHNMNRYFMKNGINSKKRLIDNQLAVLKENSINERDFPILSEEFKEKYRILIAVIIQNIESLYLQLNAYYDYGYSVRHFTTTEIRDGRPYSLIWHRDVSFSFKNGDMLYALDFNYNFLVPYPGENEKKSKKSEAEITLNINRILEPYKQNTEGNEEEELCITCYCDLVEYKLKCCGKLQHKECLYKWWSQVNHNFALKCPHCQRKVENI